MDNPKPQDTQLRVHIKNSKPIEISQLAASMNSLGNLYSSYVHNNAESVDMAQAKLYVEKISEGSIDIYLQELFSASVLPFMENANTIIDFAGYIKTALSFFIHGQGEKPDLSIQDCQDFNNVLSIPAADVNGSMEIGAVVRGDNNSVFNHCTFNFTEGNSGQNQLRQAIQEMKSLEPANNTYRSQLMRIYQMRSDMKEDKGNKAIIEEISKNKIPVVFDTDELKNRILNSDSNPVKRAFFVDVEVKTINSRIVAYNVLALHDVIDLDE